MPLGICSLCGYLDEHGYPISGCFEINARGKEDAASWFHGDEAMQRQIAVFGNGSTGSTYVLWLAKNQNPEEAPIVVLGSEGDFIVLATNAIQFCRLLGCGYNEFKWDDLSVKSENCTEAQKLRDWLTTKLGLDIPMTGAEIAAVAQDNNPDLGLAKLTSTPPLRASASKVRSSSLRCHSPPAG